MQRFFRHTFAALIAAVLLPAASIWALPSSSPRQQLDADANWKFMLGDPAGAESIVLQ